MTSVPGASGPVQYDYDYDNRLKGYTYGIDGKRLVQVTPFESSQSGGPKVRLGVYFYLPGGQIQGIYDYNPYRTYSSDGYPRDWAFQISPRQTRVYFAGRWVGGVDVNSRLIYRVAQDRLGSVRAGATFNSNTGNLRSGFSGYFPYGEQRYGNGANFATYTRDGDTGLDDAQQRQYGSQYGVFTTADPYVASGGTSNPGSWNRYAYVGGDPVNGIDPKGLLTCFFVNGQFDSCQLDPWDQFPSSGSNAAEVGIGIQVPPSFSFVGTSFVSNGLAFNNLNGDSAKVIVASDALKRLRQQIAADQECLNWLSTVNPQTTVNGFVTANSIGYRDANGIINALIPALNWYVAQNITTPDGPANSIGAAAYPFPGVDLIINGAGAFFYGSRPTAGLPDLTTPELQLSILIHELAHINNVSGFYQNDGANGKEKENIGQ